MTRKIYVANCIIACYCGSFSKCSYNLGSYVPNMMTKEPPPATLSFNKSKLGTNHHMEQYVQLTSLKCSRLYILKQEGMVIELPKPFG